MRRLIWAAAGTLLLATVATSQDLDREADVVVARIETPEHVCLYEIQMRELRQASRLISEYRDLCGEHRGDAAREFERHYLRVLVEDHLLSLKARSLGLSLNAKEVAEVDSAVESVAQKWGGLEHLKSGFADLHVPFEFFVQLKQIHRLAQKVLAQEVQSRVKDPSDDEMRDYYASHGKDFFVPEYRRVLVLSISKTSDNPTARVLAEDLRASAEKNPGGWADPGGWAESTSNSTAIDPHFTRSIAYICSGAPTNAELDAIIADSARSGVHLVETPGFFHVVDVIEQGRDTEAPFEAVQYHIRTELRERAWKREMGAFFERLKMEFVCKILLRPAEK